MDLDDDELWATQYAKKYIKKSTVAKDYISKDVIRNKIKELEDIYQREEEENGYNDETYMYYIPQIKVLKEMLGEL